MKSAIAILFVAGCAHTAPVVQPTSTVGPEWAPLTALVGTWAGEDPTSHARGRFTLAPDLEGHVLVRRNTDDSARGHHEDLMIITRGPQGLRAIYVDNEDHVIAYAITGTATHVEMTSDEVAGAPRFRLTYDVRGPDELAIDFAIAPPGASAFQHYAGGTVHRVR